MIGNLFLALGLAFLSGSALSTNNFKNVEIQNVTGANSVSFATGEPCITYAELQFDLNTSAYNLPNLATIEFDIDENKHVTQTSLTETSIINNYSHYYADYGSVNYVSLFAQKQANYMYYRLIVPNSSLWQMVYNVEFSFSPNNAYTDTNGFCHVFYGNSESQRLMIGSFKYDYAVNIRKTNWFLLRDILNYQALNVDSDFEYSNTDNPKFFDFLIRTPVTSQTDYSCYFRFLGDFTGQYSHGYDDGYANGYISGLSQGYSNGYAEGLAVGTSANANVKNLFGVLADTPIRFLKQMFNFELFGMNVAVVILSCLTAICMFALIKKIWK